MKQPSGGSLKIVVLHLFLKSLKNTCERVLSLAQFQVVDGSIASIYSKYIRHFMKEILLYTEQKLFSMVSGKLPPGK